VTKRLIFLLFLLAGTNPCLISQTTDTLQISLKEAENIFLQNNLMLLAQQLDISKADALVKQARLWPNPVLEIDEVNFWATEHQLRSGETLPPMIGNMGKNRQLSVQVEQLIQTAGKRKKMLAIAEIDRHSASAYFELLLLNLKFELRKSFIELTYVQEMISLYKMQTAYIAQLTNAYEQQFESENISRAHYVRLKALKLELNMDIAALNAELHTIQRELRGLLFLPGTHIVAQAEYNYEARAQKARQLGVEHLYNAAVQNKPDLALLKYDRTYYEKLLSLEKAKRVPDLSLSAGYDRGGNFLLDFIGFGVGFELPAFNRNQGNIRYANIGIQRSELILRQAMLDLANEIQEVYDNLLLSMHLIDENVDAHLDEMEQLLESFTINLNQRNLSLITYLDFMEAYLTNRKTVLLAKKDLKLRYEELQYLIGIEIE
jgi:outer membrane protein, heavy metal efflux system